MSVSSYPYSVVHRDSEIREYFVLPEKQLHAVDPTLDWNEAATAEPYTIGAQATWRSRWSKVIPFLSKEQDQSVYVF